MPISRETLDQLRHLLQPIRTRAANTIVRGVVRLVNDVKKLQLLQIGALAGETIDDAEHFQAFGFTSVPLDGAEHVTLFPSGDRSHPLTIAVSDRRYRPTGAEPGTVTVYNHTGAKITMTKDGDIEVQPAPGREVFIRDEGGSAERLVKQSEFLEHGHPIIANGATSPCAGPVTGGAPAGTSATFPGTQRLRVQ